VVTITAAIFGLLGVVVGAVINGGISALSQRRTERSELRSAARLVRSELVGFRAVALEGGRRTAEELPQLRNAAPVLWQANRAILSRALDSDDWETVSPAYAHVNALLSVLVFEPDGGLVHWRRSEAQRLLAVLIEPAERATDALRTAAGVESRSLSGSGSLEYPEQGPVAV
jgi:hypothetical protein